MKRRIANLLLLVSVAWSAPGAAHFVITSPIEGGTCAPGDTIEIGINIMVHHDPDERFDILFIDGSGTTTELATGLDDTEFPYMVTLPNVDATEAKLGMVQHGPDEYRYDQSVDIHMLGKVEDYEAPAAPLSAFASRPANYNQEAIDITLEPGEGMEYKYRLEPGGTLLFSWTSNALVHYELHSEPDGAPRGFSESYDKQDDRNEAHGSFAARFAGIHG